MEADLRQALVADQFHLVYQPFLNLVTHEVTGYEALLRWEDPEHGSVPPAQFIPIAEMTSLIDEIGDYVLRHAIQTASTWPAHMRLSVNLSIRQLRDHSLVDKILGYLHQFGLSADRLELEITESKSIAGIQQVVETLHQLRAHGISISLDDFGTGYSSMTYLCHLPVDRIKIDRMFISCIETRTECASIVKASVHLAMDLGRKVIAEGVETPAQLAFLEKLNCHEAQGYLIARPMPADQIPGFRPQLAAYFSA
jgi:EAL domain-containing protein (putative c-di-GMP-specific phosphodiesterase class I)